MKEVLRELLNLSLTWQKCNMSSVDVSRHIHQTIKGLSVEKDRVGKQNNRA